MNYPLFITITGLLITRSVSLKQCGRVSSSMEYYDEEPGDENSFYTCNGDVTYPLGWAFGDCSPGNKYYAYQCAKDPDEFYSYQLESFGYRSTGDGANLKGHLAICWGYGACDYSTITFSSSIRCYGARSCEGSTMSAIWWACRGYQSCQHSTITQTTNGGHQISCSGLDSCQYAEITGPDGVNLVFSGESSATGAIITTPAGKTSKIDCRQLLGGDDLADCGSATLVLGSGASVECTSDGTSQDVSVCGQVVYVPVGVDVNDFIRDNIRKDHGPNDRPDDGFWNDDNFYPVNEPNGNIINVLNNPMYMMAFLLVLSIVLNCCQGYKIFSKKRITRKKVYQGVAQTDNSDVELM